MAIPQLSAEERQAALEKAKAARIKRAQVRDDLKSGKLSLQDVLAMKDDPIVGRMKVSTLIETLPGYGKARKPLCSSASLNRDSKEGQGNAAKGQPLRFVRAVRRG